MVTAAKSDALFDATRPALLRVGYRMLGSVTDAEDVVQDAWVRWSKIDRTKVRKPAAYLRRVVVRLCIDALKSSRTRRETYTGPWLPEPIVEAEETEDVTLPLLLALERLSPLERAAFLLHDVFGEDFEEIAEALGRDPTACRQLASRARRNVRDGRPRFPVSRERGLEIASAFFGAARRGDVQRLRTLLADDVHLYADGGGKRPAARRVLAGHAEVTHVLAGIAKILKRYPAVAVRYAFVNGLPGFVTEEADGLQTTALLIDGDRIMAIYVMRNPDKLQHLKGTVH